MSAYVCSDNQPVTTSSKQRFASRAGGREADIVELGSTCHLGFIGGCRDDAWPCRNRLEPLACSHQTLLLAQPRYVEVAPKREHAQHALHPRRCHRLRVREPLAQEEGGVRFLSPSTHAALPQQAVDRGQRLEQQHGLVGALRLRLCREHAIVTRLDAFRPRIHELVDQWRIRGRQHLRCEELRNLASDNDALAHRRSVIELEQRHLARWRQPKKLGWLLLQADDFVCEGNFGLEQRDPRALGKRSDAAVEEAQSRARAQGQKHAGDGAHSLNASG